MREGLRGILGHEQYLEVVAEAADGKEAVDLIDEASPDVVIMDMAMPRMDGVEATKWITKHRPDIRVVGLSMHNSKDMGDAMINAGASAYVAKGGAVQRSAGCDYQSCAGHRLFAFCRGC